MPDGELASARGGGELIGDLDGPLAVVDRSGSVAPVGEGWRVVWAVGAGDRWHVAAEEAAVRSGLIDDMPATATLMRVPGGDVALRVAAGRAGPARAAVLEFVDDSPVAVNLAVGVAGSIKSAAVRGSRLLADGRAVVDLGRTPGGTAAVDDGDVWRAVRAEPSAGDCEARSREGRAAAAAVIPLAPRVPLRVTAAGVESRSLGSPGDVGSPEEIAAGWRAVVERAAVADFPDEAAARAWRRGIAASILAAGRTELSAAAVVHDRVGLAYGCTSLDWGCAARAAVVLDRVGLPDEADRARGALVAAAEHSLLPPLVAAAALRALASRRLRTGRVSGLAEWAGPLAEAAGDHLDPLALEQVAAVLETEAPAAARDARRLLAEASPVSVSRSVADDELAGTVRRSVAFGGDGLDGVEALLHCLVAEAEDHLVIAPDLPAEWTGAPVDTRGLLTRHGVLAFAVRWHGTRPALLWDLTPADRSATAGPADEVALRCGLDPSWTTSEPAGEVLLG
ncbi:MAG: hypothetical protein OXL98_14600 [Acidimicrobiaceae bacterium]|nr:hypothetical protein [Acidimicrobiaceae bacterium]